MVVEVNLSQIRYATIPLRRKNCMKNMKRLLCLLLTLVLVLSMIPMFAAAKEEKKEEKKVPTGKATVKVVLPSGTIRKDTVKVKDKKVKLKYDYYLTVGNTVYERSYYKVGDKKVSSVTIPAYDETEDWKKSWGNTVSVVYVRHYHTFEAAYNRLYHWDACDCGATKNKESHVDPATDEDKICFCGYKFSNNCELGTLWLKNMTLSPRFDRNNTEYIGQIVTYKPVTETYIVARANDALATVSEPTDVTLRDGINKFEITVTAEDKTTTRTYTVIATKPVKVNDVEVVLTDKDVTASPKARPRYSVAKVSVDAAVGNYMIEEAEKYSISEIVVAPNFNKGSAAQTEVTMTADTLKAAAEKNIDLLVKTPHDVTLDVPAEELKALADMGDITFVVCKDATFSILANGEAISDVPAKIAVITH